MTEHSYGLKSPQKSATMGEVETGLALSPSWHAVESELKSTNSNYWEIKSFPLV